MDRPGRSLQVWSTIGSVILEMKNKRLHTVNGLAGLLGLPNKVRNSWFRSCLWEKNENCRKVERISSFLFDNMVLQTKSFGWKEGE